ncbi:MAG: phosphatase PAP2 family protein [Oscillospiraceae bacterium]|nr:phosphatase PAP2 family protein [Oscillospiraceae bacterium]
MTKYIERFLSVDEKVLYFINSLRKYKILNIFMIFFTYIASTSGVAIIVSVLFLTKIPMLRHLCFRLSIAIIIAAWFVKIIKHFLHRIRPYVKFTTLNTKKIGIDKYSFPSGHTTTAFSMATTACFIFPQFSVFFILAASLVGLSRIYLGVHFPSDILGGAMIGISVAHIINFIILHY